MNGFLKIETIGSDLGKMHTVVECQPVEPRIASIDNPESVFSSLHLQVWPCLSIYQYNISKILWLKINAHIQPKKRESSLEENSNGVKTNMHS